MPITIPVQEAIFAFTSGFTFREYLNYLPTEQRQFLTRRYESLRIDPDSQSYLSTYATWTYLILLTSEEMPDTSMVLPIVQRLAESCPRMDLRIVSEEADLVALNEILDDEIDLEEDLSDLDLPLLFFFDEEWNQQAQWGPRPRKGEKRLEGWLSRNPQYELLFSDAEEETGEDEGESFERMMTDLTHQMRLWYNDDLTQAVVREILQILDELQSEE